MKIELDTEATALYFRLTEADIRNSEKIQSGVIIDYDAEDRIIGMEFLNVSKRASSESLKTLHFETM